MAQYTGSLIEALATLKDADEVREPSATLFGVQRVIETDEAGNPIEKERPSEAPGATPERPAFVSQPDGNEFHVRVDGGSVMPDVSLFPGGRLPVNPGTVPVMGSVAVTNLPAPVPPVSPPDPPGSSYEAPAIVEQQDGDKMHVKVDNAISPDLSRFPGGRLPVDTGLVFPAPATLALPPIPPAFPESVELRGEALELLESLADAVVARLRARSRAGWTDLAAELGGPLWTLGGHPDAESYEWVFTTAQTNQVLMAGTPGIVWKVVGYKVTTSAAGSANVACRVGFASPLVAALPTISNNSLTALRGLVISEAAIAPGSGVVEGTEGGIVAVSRPGDSLIITCGAATGGALRIKIVMYPVPG